jgi:hypothetical protein
VCCWVPSSVATFADFLLTAACLDGRAWVLLMAAYPALLVGCGAMVLVGVFTKRVAVKRWAVWMLPIGLVPAWIVYIVLTSMALDA